MKVKRITRLVKLLQMLHHGRGLNSDGLAKACGVGRRTIFRDMDTLRSGGVPIEFDSKAQRYSVCPEFFGSPSDLSVEEALALWALAGSVGSEPQFPIYADAHSALTKLEASLPNEVRRQFVKLSKAIRIIPHKVAHLGKKAPIYHDLIAAILNRRAVEIEYSSLTEWDRIKTKIKPYVLLFCQHSWYVVGHSSYHQEVRNFNLLRIEAMNVLKQRYSIPKSFDWDEHLGGAWNMIREGDRDNHVVVRFGSLVAKNVAEVHWHDSQRTKFMPDGSLIFQVSVSGLSEIAWWIMGYGDQAEVLKPTALRRQISRRIQKMAALYKLSSLRP